MTAQPATQAGTTSAVPPNIAQTAMTQLRDYAANYGLKTDLHAGMLIQGRYLGVIELLGCDLSSCGDDLDELVFCIEDTRSLIDLENNQKVEAAIVHIGRERDRCAKK